MISKIFHELAYQLFSSSISIVDVFMIMFIGAVTGGITSVWFWVLLFFWIIPSSAMKVRYDR